MGFNVVPLAQKARTKTLIADSDLNLGNYDLIATDVKGDTAEFSEFVGGVGNFEKLEFPVAEPIGYAPIGSIIAYASNTPPNGWLLCDGSAVSRSTYDKLYDVIGTIYGAGNGSTTFNLPNLINRNLRGFTSVGAVGGSDTVTLNVSNLPSHNHGAGNLSAVSNGAHTHDTTDIYSSQEGQNPAGAYGGDTTIRINGVSSSAGAHTHSISGTTGNTGGGSAITITNPYMSTLYIIRAL